LTYENATLSDFAVVEVEFGVAKLSSSGSISHIDILLRVEKPFDGG